MYAPCQPKLPSSATTSAYPARLADTRFTTSRGEKVLNPFIPVTPPRRLKYIRRVHKRIYGPFHSTEGSSYGDLADDGRFVIHSNGSLTIKFIKKSDGGRYHCRAIGPKGQRAENSVMIHPAGQLMIFSPFRKLKIKIRDI
jgi:hypothetical protein